MPKRQEPTERPAFLDEFEAKFGKVKRTIGKPVVVKPPEPTAVELLAIELRARGVAFTRELVFHPQLPRHVEACPVCLVPRPESKRRSAMWTRVWAFDFAWPDQSLALEVDGWGRHQTYTGYRGDCDKLNSALLHGWRVLRVMAGEKKFVVQWADMVQAALTLAQ